MKTPRSPRDTIRDIVYVPRMIEKIRLHAAGDLPPDYHANLGGGFDERACSFLGVAYADLAARVRAGGADKDIIAWCFERGGVQTGERIEIWNSFMEKRGWRDAGSQTLARRKTESGFSGRDDIMTFFDYIDADEGR